MSVSTLIWGKAVTNAERFFPQAELRGLKVLPPHGAWVTEANIQVAYSPFTVETAQAAKEKRLFVQPTT